MRKNLAKKFGVLLALMLLFVVGAQAQFSSTTNMGMKKPNAGLTTGWDTYLNGNFDQLDAYLSGINTLTQNSATPSVAGAMNWKTNNTSGTAYTNFTGGFSGQRINIFCTDVNGTIASGATITVQSPFACTTTNSISFVLSGSAWIEVARTRVTTRACDIAVGDTSGSVIANAQLGPQKRICQIPGTGVVQQITVSADAGTPNVIVGRSRCTTFSAGACTVETRVNLLSGALATGTSGVDACSNTGGTTAIDGGTTCTNTLQNTALLAGDYIELVSGTAGGTAKLMTIHITYTVN